MGVSEPTYSTQPVAAGAPRVRNGLGVAALVIGVASLVAGLSFVLFPLALIGGLVGLIIAIIALARRKARGCDQLGPGHRRPDLQRPGAHHRDRPECARRDLGRPQHQRVHAVRQVRRPGLEPGSRLQLHRPVRQRRPSLRRTARAGMELRERVRASARGCWAPGAPRRAGGAGLQGGHPGNGRGAGPRPVSAEDRGGRVLLRPGSPAECNEVRAGNGGALTLRPDGQWLASPSRTTAGASTGPRRTGLQGISDRLGALGGTADVTAAPGRGTRVTGRVPGTELA